jgi:hypothetical protein
MKLWTKAGVQGAACGLALGVVLLTGVGLGRAATVAASAPAVPDVVKARRFEVVDATGKLRVALGVRTHGWAGLTLYDAAGKTRAILTLHADGSPSLYLSDGTEKLRASLGVAANGSPRLSLLDAAVQTRADLGVLPDGSPALYLYDAAGKARATLGCTTLEVVKTGEARKRAESSLVLFDKDGKVIWEAP